MTCPKCGFVSFPGLAKCKKCGYPLAQPALKFDSEAGEPPRSARGAHEAPDDLLDRAFEAQPPGRSGRSTAVDALSFESLPKAAPAEPIIMPREPAGARAFIRPPAARETSSLDSFSLPGPPENSLDAGEDDLLAAPLGQRLLAALIDAGILGLAGCLFALVLALARGKPADTPFNVAVAVFVAAFWIFVYAVLFTALAARTPGQAACGLAVENLDGKRPTPQQAFLRGFGYLVSMAALMLGFIWAAMDSDGMAWHDHISGTLLVGGR